MAVSCDDHCVIEKLLQTPLSSLSYDDKLKILEEGAPNPIVSLHNKIKTCSLDEAIPWLCGCNKLNK
jgi:hypothetical protein